MNFLILGVLIVVLIFGPQVWVRLTLEKYSKDRPDLQGTGGELAEHLIERFELDGVRVCEGRTGEDYYNPDEKLISLSPEHYSGKSIAAVAVATHETGHAIQHKEKHEEFMQRKKRILFALMIERFSAMALMAAPLLFLLSRTPHFSLVPLTIGLIGMLSSLWVQMVNLPIEIDASFNKAMPILEEGYLSLDDIPAARKVLKAAAFTYVAAALASFLNLSRWLTILRK